LISNFAENRIIKMQKIHKLISFFLVAFSLFVTSSLSAQGFTDLQLSLHKGSIFAHAESVDYISGNTLMAQVDLLDRTKGQKAWQKAYGFPTWGVGLMYLDFGNSWLKQGVSIVTFIEPHIIRTNRFELSYRVGFGAAFVTNPYDSISNPQNIMHGSSMNFTMQGMINLHYKLSEKATINGGVSLTHFSNGAFKKPNKGSNVNAFSLGMTYNLKQAQASFHPKELTPSDKLVYDTKGLDWYVSLGFGIKENNPPGDEPFSGDKYGVYLAQIYAGKRLNYKSNLLFGINLIDNRSVKFKREEAQANGRDLDSKDYKRIAIVVGHELTISKVALLTQLGYYAYNPYSYVDRSIFQRYGAKYYFNKNIFGGFSLYTHFAKAEIIEYSVGYKF
jgi:hypothetical protein